MTNQNPSHPTSADNAAGTPAAQQVMICCPPGASEMTITIRFAPVSQTAGSGHGAAGSAAETRQEEKPRRRFGIDLDTLLEGLSVNQPE
ncbi:MAG: hypothetical protein J6S75_03840 [Thermoguttaceae bacterium]|nr:hypothetical protein [Thermoguttaceae bacterium]